MSFTNILNYLNEIKISHQTFIKTINYFIGFNHEVLYFTSFVIGITTVVGFTVNIIINAHDLRSFYEICKKFASGAIASIGLLIISDAFLRCHLYLK